MLSPMRQVWITKAGSPEVLVVKEATDPVAGPGEVRVRVRAAGINFADLMARVGLYPDAPKLPCVVGYEVSGVIDQLGEGTRGFDIGERVMALCHFGGYSDVITLPSSHLLRDPGGNEFRVGGRFPRRVSDGLQYVAVHGPAPAPTRACSCYRRLVASAWRRFKSQRRAMP